MISFIVWQEYSAKQLIALVSCMAHIQKKVSTKAYSNYRRYGENTEALGYYIIKWEAIIYHTKLLIDIWVLYVRLRKAPWSRLSGGMDIQSYRP